MSINLDDLAPPAHEFSEVTSLWLRERSCLWPHALSEEGDHLSIERIGLGEAAHGPGEVTDLARVDDADDTVGGPPVVAPGVGCVVAPPCGANVEMIKSTAAAKIWFHAFMTFLFGSPRTPPAR